MSINPTYHRYREKGLCGICGTVKTEGAMCKRCRNERNKKRKELRQYRKDNGLCRDCGAKMADEDLKKHYTRCSSCREKSRQYPSIQSRKERPEMTKKERRHMNITDKVMKLIRSNIKQLPVDKIQKNEFLSKMEIKLDMIDYEE